MKKKDFLVALFITVVICTACAFSLRRDSEKELKPRGITNNSQSEDVKEMSIAEGCNIFAVEFYKKLSAESGQNSNFFFSPFSIYTAFGMLYEGAGGETPAEFEKVFGFIQDSDKRHEAFLEQMKMYGKFKDRGISAANSLWVRNDFPVKDSYKDIVSKFYYAEAQNFDLSKNAAADKINEWVSDNTAGKIKNVIDSASLKESAMVLVNTIYFMEKWEKSFDKDKTQKEDFFVNAKNKVKTDLMKNHNGYQYFENKTIQAVKLKYKRDKCNASMIVVLPKTNDISYAENFIFSNDAGKIDFSYEEGTVFLPKFEIEWGAEIKNLIKSMGLKSHDYSGITREEIDISQVVHKTVLKVDEEGTEAAAATYVNMAKSAGYEAEPRKPFVFRADHPFVYMIVDNNDDKILFMGKMVQP